MDVVGVMAEYAATDLVHVNGHDRIILVIFSQALYKAPWWWILCDPKHVGALLKYFIILIISIYYILCVSCVMKCLNFSSVYSSKTFCLHWFPGVRERNFVFFPEIRRTTYCTCSDIFQFAPNFDGHVFIHIWVTCPNNCATKAVMLLVYWLLLKVSL